MTASARYKVIMKAEFVRRKNILLRCDVNALAKIKNHQKNEHIQFIRVECFDPIRLRRPASRIRKKILRIETIFDLDRVA